jgi:hypothetical protein
MLEMPEVSDFNDDDAVFEVLADAQMSEVEIAVAAGIPIAKTRAALAHLARAGRIHWFDDEGLIVWSRT